jgi:hypothetical protein
MGGEAMKLSPWILLICALIPFGVAADSPSAQNGQTPPAGGSTCIDCHTNVKQLIRLCWKVEALKPKRSMSKETSGEG